MGQFVDPGSSTGGLPEQFGKYSILGHLATGGMAEVYLARQIGLQGFEKIVVIKRIRPELTDVETTGFFLDEARLVATLEHPNIAQVIEIGLVNGSYFFVMEYVHGADLRQLIVASLRQRFPVQLADAVYIISHVCAALHYAHEKCDLDGNPLAIIHRDVSPSNVLLSHDGAVKVCDFGIAKATSRQTETVRGGVLKGKFSYMSPEQCKSEVLDRRSDVFAIGILLYELSTLTRLFKAQSDFELLRQIIEAPIPPPSSRVIGYPPALERIVQRALAKNPAERYPTAQAMQLDLEEFAREEKLAMSSVNIAKLMGRLFEKKLDAWARAQRSGTLDEHVKHSAGRRSSAEFPQFGPVGSDRIPDLEPEIAVDDDTAVKTPSSPSRRSQPMQVVAYNATTEPIRLLRRGTLLWLVAAIVCGVLAGGVMIAGKVLANLAQRETSSALESDVERLASTFESASRSVRIRVDGIVTTPMLRAAIETDAATLKDLAEHEYMFPTNKGETLEVFQIRNGTMLSLLRIPATAPPIKTITGQQTRLETDGKMLTLVSGAPIRGDKKIGGEIALSVPIDVTLIKHSLATHAGRATLVGGDVDIPLVEPAPGVQEGPTQKLALPPSADLGLQLTLVAAPLAATNTDWLAPVGYAAMALAGILLLVYIAAVLRARRESR